MARGIPGFDETRCCGVAGPRYNRVGVAGLPRVLVRATALDALKARFETGAGRPVRAAQDKERRTWMPGGTGPDGPADIRGSIRSSRPAKRCTGRRSAAAAARRLERGWSGGRDELDMVHALKQARAVDNVEAAAGWGPYAGRR